MSEAAEAKGPADAVGSFADPKTGETIFIVPKEGESPTDATARVKKDHNANPDLGPFAALHDHWMKAQNAMAAGDKAGALTALRPVLDALHEGGQKPEENGEARALNQQRASAQAMDDYMSKRSTRQPVPTPEIPQEAQYEGLFTK